MRSGVIVPRLYLGTMTFGWSSQTSSYVDEKTAREMVERFAAHNNKYSSDNEKHCIDTARIYAGGKTETIVGKVLSKLGDERDRVLLGTKAHPSQPSGLSKEGIRSQLEASVESMGLDPNVELFEYYLHQPDTEHSLLESLEAVHELVLEGTIARVGMSNYHSSETQRAFDLCREHDLTLPSVYQGLYNPLNRQVEEDLLPVLRREKASFVAYNPLAAGLLSGKHKDPGKAIKGRFKNNQNYLPRFYTKDNFEAIDIIRNACEKEGISMVDATYRWMMRHSALGEGDGILVGASSLAQLEENLMACATAVEQGPLSDKILAAFDEGWKITSQGSFPYWRSYSKDMPDRDNLDQGASYSAAKK